MGLGGRGRHRLPRVLVPSLLGRGLVLGKAVSQASVLFDKPGNLVYIAYSGTVVERQVKRQNPGLTRATTAACFFCDQLARKMHGDKRYALIHKDSQYLPN